MRTLKSEKTDSTASKAAKSPDTNSFTHFIDAVDTVTQLKRERRRDEAEELLRWCIAQAEVDDEFADPPPWYYKHLAIVYRKDDRDDDEVRILERYLSEATTPVKTSKHDCTVRRNSQRARNNYERDDCRRADDSSGLEYGPSKRPSSDSTECDLSELT